MAAQLKTEAVQMHFYGKVALVGVVHSALFVLLYYGRISGLSSILTSDVLVFALPAILAFDSYLYLAWFYVPQKYGTALRTTVALIISLFAVAISSLCGTTIAFNLWGT
jgi:hypothetical protein